MAEKKYQIPDGMLRRLNGRINADRNTIELIAEEVLRDLAENPVRPKDSVWSEIWKEAMSITRAQPFSETGRAAATIWMCRAFAELVPDPDAPIKDLLTSYADDPLCSDPYAPVYRMKNQRIREALRRGIEIGRKEKS